MKWRLYPEFKPSGVEWLGDIPDHWTMKRIKHTGTIRYGLGEPPEYVDDGLPFIRATDIKRGKVDLDDVKKVSKNGIPWSRRPLLNFNEILIVRSGAYTGDSAIVTEHITGCVAGYDMVLTVNKAHALFIAWVLLSKYMLNGQIFLERLRAAQPHLNAEELGGFLILIPPLPEQRAIASFLDRETARIDAFIEKKLRQIELLQEKRTALINYAVTKGLNPNVKMKDSGIEWLGEVPEHWEVKRLKRIARLRSGESITSYEIDDTSKYPVYGGNGLRGYTSSYTHEGEFVLIGRQGALCGCINYARDCFWASEHAIVVTPIGDVDTLWIGELLRTMNLNRYSQSAAQPGLAVETVSALFLPLPPLNEQRAIHAFIDFEMARMDPLRKKVEESIEILREYRTALISAAVTGKIDVREVLA